MTSLVKSPTKRKKKLFDKTFQIKRTIHIQTSNLATNLSINYM